MSDIFAIILVADCSATVASEWVDLVTKYIVPHTKHVGIACADSQLRIGTITYSKPTSRPSPIVYKRWFSTLEQIGEFVLDKPSRFGLGTTEIQEEGSGGMAALEGIVAALEMFDVLYTTGGYGRGKSKQRLLCHLVHVAACPPDSSRNPSWNNNPAFDHITWDSLPSQFRQRDIHYSMFLLRHLPMFKRIHSSICPSDETIAPWFPVKPNHTCLLWSPPDARVQNLQNSDDFMTAMTLANPTAIPMIPNVSSFDQYRLFERYCQMQTDLNRFKDALQSGRSSEAQILRQTLTDDFSLYLGLHEHFKGFMAPQSITIGDYNDQSNSSFLQPQLQLKNNGLVDELSVFQKTEPSEISVPGARKAHFGIEFADYPPRVITQMYSLETSVPSILGYSPWKGEFSWTASDPATKDPKHMKIGVLGLNPGGARDLLSHKWPKNVVLQTSQGNRVPDADFHTWMKRYDPIWCQFIPSPKPNADGTLNEIVFRQLIDRLIDQNVYAFASWHVSNAVGMRHNIVLLPYGTSGLVGAAFESVGAPPFPQSSGALVEVQSKAMPTLAAHWNGLLGHLSPWCAETTYSFSSPESNLSTPQNGSLQGEDFPMINSPLADNFTSTQFDDNGYIDGYDENLLGLDWQDADAIRKVTEEGLIEAATPLLYSF